MGKRRQPKSDYTRKSPDAAAAASRNEEKDEGENNAGDEWNRRSLYKVNKRKVVGGWNCPTNSLPICNELQRHRRNAGNVSSEKTGRLCPVSEFRERPRSSSLYNFDFNSVISARVINTKQQNTSRTTPWWHLINNPPGPSPVGTI